MELQDVKRAAETTGLTVDQLHWMIKRGRLTAYQPGGPHGKLYIRPTDLKKLMQPVRRGQK